MAFIYGGEPVSGFPADATESIKRKCSAHLRDCREFYVGITSNGDDGLKSRRNRWATMTSSLFIPRNFRRAIESELVDFYGPQRVDGSCANMIGGGGGPMGQPPYYVYVARKS